MLGIMLKEALDYCTNKAKSIMGLSVLCLFYSNIFFLINEVCCTW